MSRARAVAGQLRRAVGALDRPTWQTGGDPPDDRRVAAGADLRDGRAPSYCRGRTAIRVHGPRRRAPPAPHDDARASIDGADADRCGAGAL